MVQIIPAGNQYSMAGANFGQGLSEQIPKEMEHYRLSQGLKTLGQKENLSPMQFATEAASVYGLSPEQQRQFGQLARLQAQGHALTNMNRSASDTTKNFTQDKSSQFQDYLKDINKNDRKIPSITSPEGLNAAINSYVSPTDDDIIKQGANLFNRNPQFYENDPQKAIEHSRRIFDQERVRNEDLIKQRDFQIGVKNKISQDLKSQAGKLGVEIPSDVYSDIEDKAINAILPKNLGGEGLTEEQSMKKYGKMADEISRDYKSLDTLGNYSFIAQNPKNARSIINNLQEKFEERDDLENFGDTLIDKNGLSAPYAYYLANPIRKNKPLNNFLSKLSDINKSKDSDPMFESVKKSNIGKNPEFETEKIAPMLAEAMGKKGSPLAIYTELNSKGYDGDVYLDYLVKNRKKLNLTEKQGRELDKPRSWVTNLNDRWLFLFSGLDKLVEQE